MTTTDSTLITLYKAILGHNLDAIDDLIRDGADLNASLPDSEPGHTALTLSVISGRPDLVKALLERGANVNGTDRNGRTALHISTHVASYPVRTPENGENDIWQHQIEIMGILLDAGADINALDIQGLRPLLVASGHSNPRAVRFLVERGALILKDQGDPTSESRYLRHVRDVRKELLRDNPDVRPWDVTLQVLDDLAQKHGGAAVHPSALYQAIRIGDMDRIEALLTDGRDVNAPIGNGASTPLVSAAACGNPDVVAKILALGADPNVHDGEGTAPLHYAIMRASSERLHERALETARVLLHGGARIDDEHPGTGQRATHYAAGHSNPRALRWLVERGASIAKDQTSPDSESGVLRRRRERVGLPNNPDVRPWDETLALLNDLATAHGV